MKKVTYKIEQFKSITIEVETEEQEKQIEELNRDFERTDRQDRRIKAKTESLKLRNGLPRLQVSR